MKYEVLLQASSDILLLIVLIDCIISENMAKKTVVGVLCCLGVCCMLGGIYFMSAAGSAAKNVVESTDFIVNGSKKATFTLTNTSLFSRYYVDYKPTSKSDATIPNPTDVHIRDPDDEVVPCKKNETYYGKEDTMAAGKSKLIHVCYFDTGLSHGDGKYTIQSKEPVFVYSLLDAGGRAVGGLLLLLTGGLGMGCCFCCGIAWMCGGGCYMVFVQGREAKVDDIEAKVDGMYPSGIQYKLLA